MTNGVNDGLKECYMILFDFLTHTNMMVKNNLSGWSIQHQ